MTTKPLKINPTLTKKQKHALRILLDNKNGISDILFGGAAGGGKSVLGVTWLIINAIKYPGTRWLMGRSRLKTLKGTTLKSFFETCKRMNINQGEHYKFNQTSGVITFWNESEIVCQDLFEYPSDPLFNNLSGLEISGAFIDECNQVSEKAKNMVFSRIRFKLDEYELEPKILLSCNPARNWVYNEYFKKNLDGTLEAYKVFIPALGGENEYVSKHYAGVLDKLDDLTKRRLKYGDWDYQDDLAIFNYDAVINMFNCKVEDHLDIDEPVLDAYDNPLPFAPVEKKKKDIIISIDVARLGKDKTCIMVWDGLEVIEVKELSKQRIDEQAAFISALMYTHGVGNEQLIIDTDGVGGGLADIFKNSKEIVNNSRPINDENYQNLKTQLYYKLAEQVNAGNIKFKVADKDIQTRLTQELQVLKRENADQDGKIKMTNKESVKKQISRSPDISDAMAFRMIHLLKPQAHVDFEVFFLDLD